MNVNVVIKNLKGFIVSPIILKKTFLQKALSKIMIKDSVWHGNYTERSVSLNKSYLVNEYYCTSYAKSIYNKYLEHNYNFLGTGWINWNTTKSSDTDGYIKIDWCRDVVTGYKFTDQKYNSDTLKNASSRTDIKRVWEIGRLNHLPYISLIAINNPELFRSAFNEVREQIFDMMSHSSVGLGAQYYCPMDVGLRCVNILVTKDIMRTFQKLDTEQVDLFWHEVDEYIMNQFIYILNNLEYNFADRYGGNHLLCDISSALFICAHYSSTKIDKIYKQLKSLFYKNVERQFLENGTNFECSSSYHRFTSEMLLFGLLSIQIRGGVTDEQFKDAVYKLNGAKELLRLLTGMDGNIIQIGDNDSGFVLKICPDYQGNVENTLGTGFIIGAISSFCGEEKAGENEQETLGYNLVQAYKNDNVLFFCTNQDKKKEAIIPYESVGDKDAERIEQFLENAKYRKTTSYPTVELGKFASIKENAEFGVIKLQYEKGEIFVRSTIDYRKMFLGHAHDDIFHFEIVTSQGRRFPDCGSVYYTGDSRIRYLYSCAGKHNSIIHDYPLLKRIDMFAANSDYHGLTFVKKHDIYMAAKGKYTHIRRIGIKNNFIMIDDASDDQFDIPLRTNEYSLGYGNLIEVDKK